MFGNISEFCQNQEGFAQVLRELRHHRKMTLQELADILAYSISQFARFEDDQRLILPVDLKQVERIADALNCSPEERVRLIQAYVCDILRSRGVL